MSRQKKSGSAKRSVIATRNVPNASKAETGTAEKAKTTAPQPLLQTIPDQKALPPAPTEVSGQVMQTCPSHATVTFRHGGFCEKCYSDDTAQRMMALDQKIDDLVLAQMDQIVGRILEKTTDIAVVERFLGRVMSRFSRASETKVTGTMKALHLVAPVDFGKPRRSE